MKVIVHKCICTKLRTVLILTLSSLMLLILVIYKLTTNLAISSNISCQESPNENFEQEIKLLPENNCKPKKNLLFLKTHKTGSSTIQNIFLRYGDNQNLTFAFPKELGYIGHPELFNRQMLDSQPQPLKYGKLLVSSSYNIFTNHARFHYNEMKFVMPIDTVFITVLRKPVCAMQSLLSFIHLEKFYNESSFARSMERFFSISPNISSYHALSTKRLHRRYGRNQMSFDLGLAVENFDKPEMISRFVEEIHSQFHLVMITDRMEESLILLRHLLCWSLDDVIVFQHNVRTANLSCNLSADMNFKIRNFNIADEILYDFFLTKFDRQVSAFGKKTMKKEIFRLRAATQSMYGKCVEKQLPIKDVRLLNHTWYSDLTLGFKQKPITDKTCRDLTMYEPVYEYFLSKKQRTKT